MMKWSSAVSEQNTLDAAIDECLERVESEIDDQNPDLIVTFVSSHHESTFDDVIPKLRERLGPGMVVGCSAGGVIGSGKEVEHRPGFALSAAVLPGVDLVPFHVADESGLPDGDAPPTEWESRVGTSALNDPLFVLLADPFSVRGDRLLTGLDYAFPDSPKVGGLASGGQVPFGNALFLGDEVHRSGLVGLAMHGDIGVDTIVAQGCRPIGRPMRVTGCNGSILTELDSRTPIDLLKETFSELDERDRSLAQHSLFVGVVMDSFNDNPQHGDFLVRNLVVDSRTGALAVSENLEEGQLLQFHLRDADTSSQDLDAMLTRYAGAGPVHDEAGALLFSCLGRGSYLYGRADHDTDMFRERVGAMPLGGFFCNGEIGQVGGSTYLHSYTSSFGIFHPKRLV
jgi:small ligand-binding sensory domain FIST